MPGLKPASELRAKPLDVRLYHPENFLHGAGLPPWPAPQHRNHLLTERHISPLPGDECRAHRSTPRLLRCLHSGQGHLWFVSTPDHTVLGDKSLITAIPHFHPAVLEGCPCCGYKEKHGTQAWPTEVLQPPGQTDLLKGWLCHLRWTNQNPFLHQKPF